MQIIYFFILFLILAVILFLIATKRNDRLGGLNINRGLSAYMKKREERKAFCKNAIMETIKKYGKITNQKAQKILGISNATATRYFEELENEGKIVQKNKSVKTYYVAV